MVQIPFQRPIQAPVADEGVVSPTNTGNGGGYTNGGYNAYYGGGASYAIGDVGLRTNERALPIELRTTSP